MDKYFFLQALSGSTLNKVGCKLQKLAILGALVDSTPKLCTFKSEPTITKVELL